MKALTQEKPVYYEFDGKKYKFVFSLNIVADCQERYGDIENITEHLQKFGEVRWLLWRFISEAIDEHNDTCADKWEKLTEKQVGRNLTPYNLNEAIKAIAASLGLGLPEPLDSDLSDEDKKELTYAGFTDIETDEERKNAEKPLT